MKRQYGWKKQVEDPRDFIHKLRTTNPHLLPKSVDLRDHMPSVYDQGQLSSCTGNAICGAFEYKLHKQGITDFMPSRLFVYYNERDIEGTVNEDTGAELRDGVKSVNQLGVCPESMWIYDPNKLTSKPTSDCYTEALKHQVLSYAAVKQDLNSLKGCLAEGNPIIFGMQIFDSFESDEMASTGVLNMPQPGEQNLGGHAVLIVSYNDDTQRFIIRNSWGSDWGQQGYFTIPYIYVTNPNLCCDFWTINVVE